MKRSYYILFLLILFSVSLFPQNTAVEMILKAESEPDVIKNALMKAAELNQPKSFYLPEGIFIDLKGIVNEKPAYVVMYNLADPYSNCEVMDYEQIVKTFNLSSARIHYTDGSVINETLGYSNTVSERSVNFLMFLESTTSRVSTLNPATGDVINLNYLTDATLSTPKQSRLTPWGFISISDQVLDVVRKYDTLGVYQNVFAPAGGVNTAILDNIRGHNYKDGFLFVTVGAGANTNSVAKFDSTGTFVGNFVAQGSGGISSPYDILFRSNDVLVSAYSSNKIHRYDMTGNYLDDFASGIAFPQQILETPDSNIINADFGVGGGIRVYSKTGTLLSLLNIITANRGVYQLGNGNYLTTNAAGLHEVSPANVLIRTIIAGVSGQYITAYDPSIIPVELISFNLKLAGNNVDLTWETASEINNRGFEIERSTNNITYSKIGYVKGAGTSVEKNSYSFRDKNPGSGKFYYRLKQLDYDGSFEYSNVLIAETELPQQFSLEQNYPNPFNPVTNIRINIPTDNFVSLDIYNAIGQKVASVFNGSLKAGTHNFSFDAKSLNSGIYYYKITSGNFSAVKKMILMK
jgi:hypothetical protein